MRSRMGIAESLRDLTTLWNLTMYLLTWNPDNLTIEANFGGCISKGEALVFVEELRDMLLERNGSEFRVVVDYSTASRLDDDVRRVLEESRETCLFGGAERITFVTRDEAEASVLTNRRLQGVLEGRERYVAFGAAA